jgi:hypothetical protein
MIRICSDKSIPESEFPEMTRTFRCSHCDTPLPAEAEFPATAPFRYCGPQCRDEHEGKARLLMEDMGLNHLSDQVNELNSTPSAPQNEKERAG